MSYDLVELREEVTGCGQLCRDVLAELPGWFGIPESVEHYVDVVKRSPTLVATADGRDVGFLTLAQHGSYSAEIYVMGVRPAYHRRGIGRMLIEHAERSLAARGIEYLQVKTLSERRTDPGYAGTRAFYFACGFRPLEESLTLWNPENPALQMIKRV